ncbi:uncharacterized protein AKAW2_50121A [Aspergillus luchuensis]|uniref:Uncharacterized protein n=1 Tax=Aspergillus kawachii TaxID=1069201 RepID=A0A7R7WB90_ASPKA|nr:uncharacterized protein AKAW2_50121A [Aspergillus luchuensis]BCR99780.1 hypothetical protein AKAW2_50121A [Aspergillus luchuensis]
MLPQTRFYSKRRLTRLAGAPGYIYTHINVLDHPADRPASQYSCLARLIASNDAQTASVAVRIVRAVFLWILRWHLPYSMATPSDAPLAGARNPTATKLLFLCRECYRDVGL